MTKKLRKIKFMPSRKEAKIKLPMPRVKEPRRSSKQLKNTVMNAILS
jgi:hypothetical protein